MLANRLIFCTDTQISSPYISRIFTDKTLPFLCLFVTLLIITFPIFSSFFLYIAYACMYGYINSIVDACQAMVQQESLISCHYLWSSWDRGLDVSSVATTKCTGLIKPCSSFSLLFCLTCQFCTTVADLLQVTIAFVLKIFFFLR